MVELVDVELVDKGETLYKLGRYEEALACFDKAIEINPDIPAIWIDKGAALYKLGRYEEVIACSDKVTEMLPGIAKLWVEKGKPMYKLGRYEEALACFDKAIEIDPKDAEAWDKRGVALTSLKRDEEALACFDKAIEIDPKDAEAWGNRGLVLIPLKRDEESLACFDKAFEINPEIAKGKWGDIRFKLDSLCKDLCKDHKDLVRSEAMGWNNRGVDLRYLGRYEEALACYNKAIEIDPSCAEAWYNKGDMMIIQAGKVDVFDLWERRKYYQEAMVYYDKGVEINPRIAHADQIKGALRTLIGFDSSQRGRWQSIMDRLDKYKGLGRLDEHEELPYRQKVRDLESEINNIKETLEETQHEIKMSKEVHYDKWGRYAGKSIQRGDTEVHYDKWGRYAGKSKKRSGGCFITTACIEAKDLADDCIELNTLRAFRDEYIKSLPNGNQVICEYYEIAPRIVAAIKRTENNKEIYLDLYERLVSKSSELIRLGEKDEAFNNYLRIVNELKRRYL